MSGGGDRPPHQPGSHRREAVVDEKLRSVDEFGVVGGEVEGGAGDVFGAAHAALGGADGGVGHVNAQGGQACHFALAMRGFDEAGADGVAADAAIPKLDRDGPGKHVTAPLVAS